LPGSLGAWIRNDFSGVAGDPADGGEREARRRAWRRLVRPGFLAAGE